MGAHLEEGWKTLLKRCGIKHGGEVFDVEVVGARKALKAALGLVERENGGSYGRQRINVLTDSHYTVKALSTGTSTTSLDDVHQFRAIPKKARSSVNWIPTYSGIQGNEEADRAAHSGIRKLPSKES